MSKDKNPAGTSPAPDTPPGPTPPLPMPLPPIQLETIWDVAKIVLVVVVFYITRDANNALNAAVDYSKLAAAHQSLCSISWHGAMIGLLQGMIMAVQALVIIWGSPTLFTYLGPVLNAFMKTPIKIVADFRRAINPRSKDGGDKDDDDKKDPDKKS